MTERDLFLVRLDLPLAGIVELARRRRLPSYDLDEGQAVHCALGEIFRDKAPKPFALPSPNARRQKPGALELYAYSSASREELLQTSQAFADLDLHSHFNPESLRDRRLPSRFPELMGFSIRLCPVVRLSGDVDTEIDFKGRQVRIERKSRDRSKKRGCEVDAFEAECIRAHRAGTSPIPSGQRRAIYLDWFRNLADRKTGFSVERAQIDGFRLVQLWRRNHEPNRRSRRLTRPEIHVSGLLRVIDQSEFRETLRRGLGRHKAFGFGMLKIRPAGDA